MAVGFRSHSLLLSVRLWLRLFPTVRQQVPVFLYGCIWWPCGTPINYIAKGFEEVYPATMTGNGQRVVQRSGFSSRVGTDCQPATRQGYIPVYSLDFVVVKLVDR